MYVRLAFAVAAHLEPEVLIVDEVLAVGDAEFQKKCLGKMDEVSKKSGRTVLFVSHNMLAIMNLCKRTILLEGGKKIADGETQSVVQRYMDGLQPEGKISSFADVNRRGRGRVRFVGVEFEDEHGNAVEHGVSGRQLTIVLNYQSEHPRTLKYPYRIGVAFRDKMGQLLFNCAAEVASTETVDLPPTGSVRCVIPKLPLSQGEYPMTLFLEIDREVEDWIEAAQTLQVLDGDFFNTGKGYSADWQVRCVLVPHYWVLKNR
jgi:lipopolysaccharide transport system ATP-binding protein